MRKVGGLVVVALAIVVFSFGPADTTTNRTLSILVITSPSATGLEAISSDFTAQSGWDVKFHYVPYDDAPRAALMANSMGLGSFDIIQFDNVYLPLLASRGALLPLDRLIEDSAEYSESDVPQKVREVSRLSQTTWGIGLSTEPMLLWHRPTVFDQAGIGVPETLAEHAAAAERLNTSDRYGQSVGMGPRGGAFFLWNHLLTLGLSPLDSTGCGATFDDEDVQAAIASFLRGAQTTSTGALFGSMDETNADFIGGESAMQINVSGYYNLISDPRLSAVATDYGFAAAPLGRPDGGPLLLAYLIGISPNSPNRQEAWRFLEFAFGETGIDRLVASGTPPPVRHSLIDDPAVARLAPYYPLVLEQTEIATTFPYLLGIDEVLDELSEMVHRLATEPDRNFTNELRDSSNRIKKILASSPRCGTTVDRRS